MEQDYATRVRDTSLPAPSYFKSLGLNMLTKKDYTKVEAGSPGSIQWMSPTTMGSSQASARKRQTAKALLPLGIGDRGRLHTGATSQYLTLIFWNIQINRLLLRQTQESPQPQGLVYQAVNHISPQLQTRGRGRLEKSHHSSSHLEPSEARVPTL